MSELKRYWDCTHCTHGETDISERIRYSLGQLYSLRAAHSTYGVSKIGLDSIEERIAYWESRLCELDTKAKES